MQCRRVSLLNQPEVEMEHHECSQCPIRLSQVILDSVLNLFHRLPNELKTQIVILLIVPRRPCNANIMSSCFDQWSCLFKHALEPSRSPSRSPQVSWTNTPCPKVTALSPFIRDEGYRQFFQNHTFIFSTPKRHHHLTALVLDITNRIEWIYSERKEAESDERNETYSLVDKYRSGISHLVLGADFLPGHRVGRPDWDWALKVNWSTLPKLKTLVLDFRHHTHDVFTNELMTREEFSQRIETGAAMLEGLNLQCLSVYGLCSGSRYWRDANHERIMESLFRKAVRVDGELVFKDEAMHIKW